jgi:hypothetical protein
MSEDFIASHSGNDAPRIAFVAQPATDFNREVGELEHPFNTTQLAQLLLGPISLANTDEHLTRRWVSISVSGSALQIAPPLETFPKHISKDSYRAPSVISVTNFVFLILPSRHELAEQRVGDGL